MKIQILPGFNLQRSPGENIVWRTCLLGLLAVFCTIAMGTHTAHCDQVLILHDSSGPFGQVGRSHAILLENLMGHFKADVVQKPVSTYKTGDMDASLATFYLGAIFDEASNYAPDSEQLANYNHFLKDVSQTSATVVWFNYNIWWLADYLQKNGKNLTELFGFSSKDVINQGFNRVSYKGTELLKGIVPHANPGADITGCVDEGAGRWACATELNAIEVVDPGKVEVLAKTYSTLQPGVAQTPYISRSGNFWLVGDLPTTHISEEDRYLALADLLHDMLGIQHEEIHRALVRLEDVSAISKEEDVVPICEYLQNARIPFAVSAIPVHVSSTGEKRNFSQSPVGQYLSRMVSPDAGNTETLRPDISIVAHGYTHQSDHPENPYDGVSGSDFEFYRVTANQDYSLNFIGPLTADVDDWAYRRMQDADKELKLGGFSPFAWSAPHYLASAKAYSDIRAVYPIHYGRTAYFIEKDKVISTVGQFFPYPIHRDTYGYQIAPENIGNYAPEPTPGYRALFAEDMIRNASKNLVVRDGYASFYYHPTQGVTVLKNTIEGVQALGYEFIAPKSIFPSTQAEGDTVSSSPNETGGSGGCFLSLLWDEHTKVSLP